MSKTGKRTVKYARGDDNEDKWIGRHICRRISSFRPFVSAITTLPVTFRHRNYNVCLRRVAYVIKMPYIPTMELNLSLNIVILYFLNASIKPNSKRGS